ncbi:MAG TPA: ubiquinol oxidase subunit II [Gallionellaceae bacterium]|nr:ubiquinol oxidase subunit II [Gallionellaceae bacterium]
MKQPEVPQARPEPRFRAAQWAALSACASMLLLSGCSKVALLDPQGPVGASERLVILSAFALMLIVVIPVVVMALWFPRRYRADNPRGGYDPKWTDSARIDTVVWLIPAVIVAVLATLTWRESHRLDPAVPIASDTKPLQVEVVSLDWKWLFIYPRQGVAAVNQLVIPANTPIDFRLTSESVITSFFIPRLGSQIYAMAGRRSHLHLLADTPGVYAGQNQQFSGQGFADMNFKVVALPPAEFTAWVHKTRRAHAVLDHARLHKLSQPGMGYPVTFYSRVSPGLFDDIVNRYRARNGPSLAAGAGGGG